MIIGILAAVFIVFGMSAGWLIRDIHNTLSALEDLDIDYTIEELQEDCWGGLHFREED